MTPRRYEGAGGPSCLPQPRRSNLAGSSGPGRHVWGLASPERWVAAERGWLTRGFRDRESYSANGDSRSPEPRVGRGLDGETLSLAVARQTILLAQIRFDLRTCGWGPGNSHSSRLTGDRHSLLHNSPGLAGHGDDSPENVRQFGVAPLGLLSGTSGWRRRQREVLGG